MKIRKHRIALAGEPLIHRSQLAFPGLTIRLPGNRTIHIRKPWTRRGPLC